LQREAAQTLAGLVNDILDLTKIEAGKLDFESVVFELRSVVTGSSNLVGHSFEAKDLTFKVSIAEDVPQWFLGDPARLRQVILNLLTNAVKFTAAGSVELTACMAGPEKTWLRIGVRDTGIGIPADKIDRLFRPFSQLDSSTNRRAGGSGLGLAICSRLVGLMGGSIHVESNPGHGSYFWFDIPLESVAGPHARMAAIIAPLRGGAPRRVLLAEDHPMNQIIISSILEAAGHRVHIVDDGEAAVSVAETGVFDIILMDMRMPNMDGIEATRHIRASPGIRQVPIVALTANAARTDIDICLAAGMDDFLAKPIDADLLLATIARADQICVVTPPATD
jgi:CheY-like chemotaxis protein